MHGELMKRTPDWEEYCKGLPNLVVEAKVADGVDVDLIHLPQHVQCLALCHISQYPHCQPWACSIAAFPRIFSPCKFSEIFRQVHRLTGHLHALPFLFQAVRRSSRKACSAQLSMASLCPEKGALYNGAD